MKPGQPIFRIFTLVVGIFLTVLALWGAFIPASFAKIMLAADQINANEASATRFLNVLFLSYGVMLLILSRTGAKNRPFVLFLGIVFLGAGLMRIFGFFVEGVPGLPMLGGLAGELITGIFLLASYRLSEATNQVA